MVLRIVLILGALLGLVLISGIIALMRDVAHDAHHHENRVLPFLLFFWVITVGGFAAYVPLVLMR